MPPRLLLVEDDASIRRLVELALADLPITVIHCPDVAQARRELEQGPVDLILTDLMLPGESGIDLLQSLQERPTLRGSARVVVFSAGLTATTVAQLEPFDVWRRLPKPIAIRELIACISEAVLPPDDAPASAVEPPAPPLPRLSPVEEQAIAEHFNGDRGLFLAYRPTCLAQFPRDIVAGNQAAAQADLPALRRLGHSLKSVLTTLGQGPTADAARQLEASAEQADLDQARHWWAHLQQGLVRLMAQDGG